MTKIEIEATDRSPQISFDFGANNFSMKGESYPEDVSAFFGDLMEKLEAHLRTQSGATINFVFDLIYFNSSTAKVLMGLFDMLDEVAEEGNEVSITWKYEEGDDNMEELGEEFGEDLSTAKFSLEEVPV